VPTSELAEGDHELTATQTDPDGHESKPSAPVHIVVDVTPPAQPDVTSPTSGSTVPAPDPTFPGPGEPRAHVEVDEGDTEICETDVAADRSWTCTATQELPDGDHEFTVTQTDPAGNPSEPTVVDVTIAPDPPTIDAPTGGIVTSDHTPTITGTGQPGLRLTLTVTHADGTVNTYQTTVASDGTWSCDTSENLNDGTYQLAATQTTRAGLTSDPAHAPLLIDTTPPGSATPTGPESGTASPSPRTSPTDQPSVAVAETGGTVTAPGVWTPALGLAGLALLRVAARRWRLA
jgi:hypothetical protein